MSNRGLDKHQIDSLFKQLRCINAKSGTGGTGGGDASAINQVLVLTALSDLLVELKEDNNAYTTEVRYHDVSALGDQTDLVKVFAQYKTDKDGGRVLIRFYEEDGTTVYPTPGDLSKVHTSDQLGVEVNTNSVRFDLTPLTSWIVPLNIQSCAIIYHVVGDTLADINDTTRRAFITTYADPDDLTTIIKSTLLEKEVFGVSKSEDTIQLQPGMTITSVHVNDRIKINYTIYNKI